MTITEDPTACVILLNVGARLIVSGTLTGITNKFEQNQLVELYEETSNTNIVVNRNSVVLIEQAVREQQSAIEIPERPGLIVPS